MKANKTGVSTPDQVPRNEGPAFSDGSVKRWRTTSSDGGDESGMEAIELEEGFAVCLQRQQVRRRLFKER